jgi:hypothetical protein
LAEGKLLEGGLLKGEKELLKGELLKGGLLKRKELLKENSKGELLKLKREHGTVQVCTKDFIHRL